MYLCSVASHWQASAEHLVCPLKAQQRCHACRNHLRLPTLAQESAGLDSAWAWTSPGCLHIHLYLGPETQDGCLMGTHLCSHVLEFCWHVQRMYWPQQLGEAPSTVVHWLSIFRHRHRRHWQCRHAGQSPPPVAVVVFDSDVGVLPIPGGPVPSKLHILVVVGTNGSKQKQ